MWLRLVEEYIDYMTQMILQAFSLQIIDESSILGLYICVSRAGKSHTALLQKRVALHVKMSQAILSSNWSYEGMYGIRP